MLVALGALTIARAGPTAAGWASLGALLLAAVFVEAFPVPIKGVRAGGISLAAVFIVATGARLPTTPLPKRSSLPSADRG